MTKKRDLRTMLASSDPYLRELAAGDRRTRGKLLDKAIKDRNKYVRAAAAGNENLNVHQLEKVLRDRSRIVRRAGQRTLAGRRRLRK